MCGCMLVCGVWCLALGAKIRAIEQNSECVLSKVKDIREGQKKSKGSWMGRGSAQWKPMVVDSRKIIFLSLHIVNTFLMLLLAPGYKLSLEYVLQSSQAFSSLQHLPPSPFGQVWWWEFYPGRSECMPAPSKEICFDCISDGIGDFTPGVQWCWQLVWWDSSRHGPRCLA